MSSRVRLRPWQSDALAKLEASGAQDFLAVATPGAGKTTFALVAAVQFLRRFPVRRIVVVAPTSHLKYQWAEASARLGVHLEPDWSPRQGPPPSDMHGIVTTYQQVASSAAELQPVAKGAFVVFDEIHHAGDEKAWGNSVTTAFADAEQRLALSGTPFRSDSSPIPFVNYHLDEAVPDFEYGYGEALHDRRVVRPVFFPRINGFMEWVTPDGETIAATFDDELTRDRANQRLRTALSLEGDWLPAVLTQGHEQLMVLRRQHPAAGGLVIAMDQAHANGIAEFLRQRFRCAVTVAISDDPSASAHIARFSQSSDPWIVAVRMVSEGVDIPRLRLGVYATTTSTELFFRQAVGRLVRWTPGVPRQRAFLLLPDDDRLATYAGRMATQRRHVLNRRAESPDSGDSLETRIPADPDEQLSLFAALGSVVIDGSDPAASTESVFDETYEPALDGDDGVDDAHHGEIGDEVVLVAPAPAGARGETGEISPGGRRQEKRYLRDANAEVARELAKTTGLSHAHVNRELNRLAGIGRVTEASNSELKRRLDAGERWLASASRSARPTPR